VASRTLPELPLGPTPLAAPSAALLGRFAAQRNRPPVLTLTRESIVDMETALGTAIPLDVVALLALEGRPLSDLGDFTAGVSEYYAAQSLELGRTVARELGWNHVAFAMLVGTPDNWTEEPRFAAFARGDRTDTSIVEWVVRKPSPGAHPYSLARYLADKWQLTDVPASPLELVLTSAQPAAVYATHVKYGRGRVLARGEGKATVAFDDGNTRKLAENFLTFES
jgi:hypothetical protein